MPVSYFFIFETNPKTPTTRISQIISDEGSEEDDGAGTADNAVGNQSPNVQPVTAKGVPAPAHGGYYPDVYPPYDPSPCHYTIPQVVCQNARKRYMGCRAHCRRTCSVLTNPTGCDICTINCFCKPGYSYPEDVYRPCGLSWYCWNLRVFFISFFFNKAIALNFKTPPT